MMLIAVGIASVMLVCSAKEEWAYFAHPFKKRVILVKKAIVYCRPSEPKSSVITV